MPDIDWQLTISLAIVAVAAVALARRAVAVIRGEGEAGCSSCSQGCVESRASGSDPELAGFVPEEKITIRYEDESS